MEPDFSMHLDPTLPTMEEVESSYGNVLFSILHLSRSLIEKQSQNDYMRQGYQKNDLLGRIISTEANCANLQVCQNPARWRCRLLPWSANVLSGCCRTLHDKLIYHSYRNGLGLYFQDAGLWEVGVRLWCGAYGRELSLSGLLLGACSLLEAEKDQADDQPPQPARQVDLDDHPPMTMIIPSMTMIDAT